MTTTVTSVSSATSSTLLIAADGTRTSLVIENTDGGRLYCLLVDSTGTATTSTGGFTFSLVENGTATLTPPDSHKAVYGIWASDGSGGATITAITDPVSDGNGASISTYGELKTAIAAWLRPNSSVSADMTTNIPKYIGLAEVMIRRELHMRVLDQADTSLDITAGVATVPTGYMGTISLSLAATPYLQIDATPLDVLMGLDQSATGDPRRYARSGSSFYFWPPTTSTAKLYYRRGVTPLSADGDTNWILAAHPDAYLYGSLLQADRRLIGPRLGEWKEGFAQALDSIQKLERNLHMEIIRPTPNGAVV